MAYYTIKTAENGNVYFSQVERFVSGFDSWQETHFEVVQFICALEDGFASRGDKVDSVREEMGIGGVYELARDWTDEFELKYKDSIWDGENEFFETLENFLTIKNKKL